jgi:hypothetical protein
VVNKEIHAGLEILNSELLYELSGNLAPDPKEYILGILNCENIPDLDYGELLGPILEKNDRDVLCNLASILAISLRGSNSLGLGNAYFLNNCIMVSILIKISLLNEDFYFSDKDIRSLIELELARLSIRGDVLEHSASMISYFVGVIRGNCPLLELSNIGAILMQKAFYDCSSDNLRLLELSHVFDFVVFSENYEVKILTDLMAFGPLSSCRRGVVSDYINFIMDRFFRVCSLSSFIEGAGLPFLKDDFFTYMESVDPPLGFSDVEVSVLDEYLKGALSFLMSDSDLLTLRAFRFFGNDDLVSNCVAGSRASNSDISFIGSDFVLPSYCSGCLFDSFKDRRRSVLEKLVELEKVRLRTDTSIKRSDFFDGIYESRGVNSDYYLVSAEIEMYRQKFIE